MSDTPFTVKIYFWLAVLTLVLTVNCSEASFHSEGPAKPRPEQGADLKAGGDEKSKTDTSEEAAVNPEPIAGLNLVYACEAPRIQQNTMDIGCTARKEGQPKEKVAGVVWSYHGVDLMPDFQSVEVEFTPASLDQDVIYHLKGRSRVDLWVVFALFRPLARLSGEMQSAIVAVPFAPLKPGAVQNPVAMLPACDPTTMDQTSSCVMTQIRYQNPSVVEPQTCNYEKQTSVCTGGVCAPFNGTMKFETCTVSRTRFELSPTEVCSAEEQSSFCANGLCSVFTGAFSARNCNKCDGAMVGGYCWYKSALNTDCVNTCATHGGVTDGTINYVGYPNGTNAQCTEVLNGLKMGIFATPALESPLPIYSAGCGVVAGVRTRYVFEPTTQTNTAIMVLAERACSCAK